MLKTTGISAAIVSAICLVASLFRFSFGPQDSSFVGPAVVQLANLVGLILYISIVFAFSFSLSFTPLLGIALLKKAKQPAHDYPHAQKTFYVSLLPFVPSLFCLWYFIIPMILHNR